MEIACNGQQKVNALEEIRVESKHDPENKQEPTVRSKGSRPFSSPQRNFLWKGPRQEKALQERTASQHASPVRRVIVKKNACDYFGVTVRFKHKGKAGDGPKKRNNSVVVAKTLYCSEAEDKITSLQFIAKGDLLHGV